MKRRIIWMGVHTVVASRGNCIGFDGFRAAQAGFGRRVRQRRRKRPIRPLDRRRRSKPASTRGLAQAQAAAWCRITSELTASIVK